jgi:hypothetical protein
LTGYRHSSATCMNDQTAGTGAAFPGTG